MKFGLLLSLLCALAGCVANPPPTPYPLQQYPAIWTPAPTPTNTPPGPTATLVIQNTRAPLPTRDPNARPLPVAPRDALGIWALTRDQSAYAQDAVAQQAQILVTPANEFERIKNDSFIFQIVATESARPLPDAFNGVVMLPTTQAEPEALQALQTALEPRWVLASIFITDTAQLEALRARADGLLLENFLRAPDGAAEQFLDEAAWKQQVNTLATLSANPDALVLTAARIAPANQNSSTDYAAWMEYALASFWLGANNTHIFFGAPDAPTQIELGQFLDMEALGAPQTAVIKANGVYQRRFARGLVLVNPSADKHAFLLPRKYRARNGAIISQIEMPPHTGALLLNADQ